MRDERDMAEAAPKRPVRRIAANLRREEILAAAGRALGDQGFLSLMFEQVAREAGASKALVYAYFPSHAALYNALLGARLAELEATIAAASMRGTSRR
jgi:AcrR family transcriptional regulator